MALLEMRASQGGEGAESKDGVMRHFDGVGDYKKIQISNQMRISVSNLINLLSLVCLSVSELEQRARELCAHLSLYLPLFLSMQERLQKIQK